MHQETILTRTIQVSEGQVSGSWTWTTEKRKSLFCCHQCRWTGSEDHFLSRQKPRKEEPGKRSCPNKYINPTKGFPECAGDTYHLQAKRAAAELKERIAPRNIFANCSLKKPCGVRSSTKTRSAHGQWRASYGSLHHTTVKPKMAQNKHLGEKASSRIRCFFKVLSRRPGILSKGRESP